MNPCRSALRSPAAAPAAARRTVRTSGRHRDRPAKLHRAGCPETGQGARELRAAPHKNDSNLIPEVR